MTPAVWTAAGVAVAAGGASVVFNALMFRDKSRYDSDATPAHADAFYRDRAIATVIGTIALTAVATGLALWWLSGREAK
jgi:hypothetical protein